MEGIWEGNKWLASASLFCCWLGLLSRLNAYTKIRWLSGGFAQPTWSRQWNRPILISFHGIYVNRRTIHPGSSHIGTVVCRSLLSRPVCWYTVCKMGLNFSSGRGICHLPQEARVFQHHTGWAGKPWLLLSRCFSVDEIILPKQVLVKRTRGPTAGFLTVQQACRGQKVKRNLSRVWFLMIHEILPLFVTGLLATPIRHLKWCVSAVLWEDTIKSVRSVEQRTILLLGITQLNVIKSSFSRVFLRNWA